MPLTAMISTFRIVSFQFDFFFYYFFPLSVRRRIRSYNERVAVTIFAFLTLARSLPVSFPASDHTRQTQIHNKPQPPQKKHMHHTPRIRVSKVVWVKIHRSLRCTTSSGVLHSVRSIKENTDIGDLCVRFSVHTHMNSVVLCMCKEK